MLLVKVVASVAQLAEQLTLNQLVLGSSPSRGTTPTSFTTDYYSCGSAIALGALGSPWVQRGAGEIQPLDFQTSNTYSPNNPTLSGL